MASITGHDGQLVSIRYSAGSQIPYFERWESNVLAPPGLQQWPAAVRKQVDAYTVPRSWFTVADASALAARLGHISKFQSINSEDALTWSWFGTLGCAEPGQRRLAVQWLYDRLELDLTASTEPTVDQWMRVIHPNSIRSPNGPELDARIDDPDVALIYVEAKWDARIGKGKGAAGGYDDQIVLRRDAFRAEPALANDHRALVVLGVSNEVPDLQIYGEAPGEPPRRPVRIVWLSWQDLATCRAHPLANEFGRYLRWKLDHTK